MAFYDREVKHVDDTAMKESRISMGRKNSCHMIVCAFFKNESVKHTINQVSEGTREDKSGADDIPEMIILTDQCAYIINSENHSSEPEQCQGHFSQVITKFPAPGHACILQKKQLKFIAQHMNAVIVRGYG